MITRRIGLVVAVWAVALATSAWPTAQGLNPNDAYRVRSMLRTAYDVVKKNYYDPKFHGLDWDARFREFDEKLKSVPSQNAGLVIIAGFLSGLKDSHTFFAPPARPYRMDYGYRLAPIGDHVFVTRVRPGTDAETKVRPGDRLISIEGTPVTRDALGAIEYLLNMLAPRPATRLRLSDAAGVERDVVVETKVVAGRRLPDLTGSGADMELADLVREAEGADWLYRQQYVEAGDVMVWKMPTFELENDEVDRVFGIARKFPTLVLDLRENPGGLVDSLRRMVGNLFDHDVKIADRITRKGRSAIVAKTRGAAAYRGKLIVLVDGGSGSAAEVLARVVQLEKRGSVIGDRSSGAVMEASFFSAAIGTETLIFYGLSVTDADLLMADGRSLEGIGVIPDETVLPTALDVASARDPVLARAAQLAGLSMDAVAAGKLFPFEWRPF